MAPSVRQFITTSRSSWLDMTARARVRVRVWQQAAPWACRSAEKVLVCAAPSLPHTVSGLARHGEAPSALERLAIGMLGVLASLLPASGLSFAARADFCSAANILLRLALPASASRTDDGVSPQQLSVQRHLAQQPPRVAVWGFVLLEHQVDLGPLPRQPELLRGPRRALLLAQQHLQRLGGRLDGRDLQATRGGPSKILWAPCGCGARHFGSGAWGGGGGGPERQARRGAERLPGTRSRAAGCTRRCGMSLSSPPPARGANGAPPAGALRCCCCCVGPLAALPSG